MTAPGPIVVFDTDCLLCSGMVAFVLAHERAPVLRFAGAWSAEGLALAARHGFSREDLDATFLVVEGATVLTRSQGALAIARHLHAPWNWLGRLLVLVPRPLRDAAYDAVARRRIRWFGRREDCTLAPSGERHRFIGVRSRPADP
ncbi:thiol-disulfide oxidoreductase DCC family protein [Methylobacterium sp. Leaf118]|uniref:thiol-disulfide oxidoreductase DCC family protein n=1 Tax=Methylobacterium sp. Leaf118 TaxID=2876562 RepID=UPI001E447FF3|nr:DCC1-like thiol-disulfide oxidoreductase family protein [Methylobacterium sp. Leaf118]